MNYWLCGEALGFRYQVEYALNNLTNEQDKEFKEEFPELNSGEDTLSEWLTNGDNAHYVADWVEENTNMFWSDGELWESE